MRLNPIALVVCAAIVGAAGASAQSCTLQDGWKKDFIRAAARDFSRTRVTQGGLYRVSIRTPDPDSLPPMGKLHEWVLHVEDTTGVAVGHATICVDGGMPEHGHGLPTSPAANGASDGGDYRIEGMKFSMSGWWVVKFVIQAPAGTDSVRFNLGLR
jgi:hypothetical protein